VKRQGYIRKAEGGVDLETFAELARTHTSLRGSAGTETINPFTKERQIILPRQTRASVVAGDRVSGRIEHAASWPGELDVFGDNREVLGVAREVADALGADLVEGNRPSAGPKELERTLEGLDAVDWASLKTPSGAPANGIPVLIRAAVSRSKAAREDAEAELNGEFLQASSASPAAVALLPFLVLLLGKNVPDREVLAGLVACFLRDNEAADVERHVEEAFPLIAPFLRSEHPDLRADVVGALDAFPAAAKPYAEALAAARRAEKRRPQPELPARPTSDGVQHLALGIAVVLFALVLHLTGARPPLFKLAVAAVGAGILIVWFVTRQRRPGGRR